MDLREALADPRARLGLGVAGLLATAGAVHRDRVGAAEARTFRAVNGLPDALYPPAWVVMQLGAFGAVPAAAAAAWRAGDGELAARLLLGGTSAWAMAKLVKQVVRRPRPADLLPGIRGRGRDAAGLGYLSGHMAVAVALGAAALPRLGPAARALTLTAIPLVGLTRLYVGAHLPLDIAGGAALGLAADAAAGLVRGPGRGALPRRSPRQPLKSVPASGISRMPGWRARPHPGAGARASRPKEAVMADVMTAQKVAARTEDAVKVYGKGQTEVRALDGVTVEFAASRYTAVMGPSGSGKSTLLHCVAGLDSLTSGRAFIGDVDLSTLSDQKLTILRRDRVGFVFQAFNLVPTLSAEKNITLPLLLAGRKGDQAWINQVIEITGIGDRLEHRPSELSGGQQQRVAVARALASRPEIIFADEPTGNLDSRAGTEVLTFLRRAVNEMGQTIVMVTHDPMAASYADRIVFLADGRIVDEMLEPTAERVLERMSRFGE